MSVNDPRETQQYAAPNPTRPVEEDEAVDIWVPNTVKPDVRDWIRVALTTLDTEEDGHYNEDEVVNALQVAKMTRNTTQSRGVCFFCKKPGHRFNKCFRLRDILVKNGMKPREDDKSANAEKTGKPRQFPQKRDQSEN